ncbi:MAG: endolytic transglycosylase MltG, partial [Actinomycetota bacterium]|nr:endolytic transglycosylase MltG [Actinomycetota bacterium]
RPVQVEVVKGSSTAAIAEKLSSAGVVRNANMFRLRARNAEADGLLKAGVYDLQTGMDYDRVITLLTAGPDVEYATVTIPEGFIVEQIAARFDEQVGIPADEFLALAANAADFADERPYLADVYSNSLEGYLFPKTYRIREGATARDVIEMMLAQFDREIATVDMTPAAARGLLLEDVVIMASIIERETKVASERPVVASVIYNRLAKNMRLEIDATIEYVLPGNRFRLRNSDLEIESPYNTYRNAGLTPGPISNPGLASIEAAVYPADTTYIYYVLTDPDGSHTFTETWEEFLVAKRKSKEVFGR